MPLLTAVEDAFDAMFCPDGELSDPFADEPMPTPISRSRESSPRRRSVSVCPAPHAPDCDCRDCVWVEMMMQEEADKAVSAEFAAYMRRERVAAEARFFAMTPDQRAQMNARHAAYNDYADRVNNRCCPA